MPAAANQFVIRRLSALAWADEYHAAMDWKDWCKLTGAIAFFLIAIWRWMAFRQARRRHSS